jgi:hypothetical protein
MSVWLTIPSARPPEEAEKVLRLYRERGYKIALWRDDMSFPYGIIDYLRADPVYPGYASAVNALIVDVATTDHTAEWFVIGGDDVLPDPNKSADEIARECRAHFIREKLDFLKSEEEQPTDAVATFGVMQPTGDHWGENPNHARPDMRSAYIDRVAGSAWIGREFARRAYGGQGPLFPGYQHMFVDEELRHVAIKLGVYWERRDLTHYHAHASRTHGYSHTSDCPEHLKKWTVGEAGVKHWKESEALFFDRRGKGFPGHELL